LPFADADKPYITAAVTSRPTAAASVTPAATPRPGCVSAGTVKPSHVCSASDWAARVSSSGSSPVEAAAPSKLATCFASAVRHTLKVTVSCEPARDIRH